MATLEVLPSPVIEDKRDPARAWNTVALAAVAALALVAFGFGVHRLGLQSLGFDETFSIWVARMPLPDAIGYLIAWDAHPPLHYVLLHYWIALAGSSEFAVRFVGLWPAVLIVPLVYQTGRALAGFDAGILAALVVAPSPFLVYYAHQARMYSLATLLSLLTICLLLRRLRDTGRRSPLRWLALLLSAVAALYTLYYTAFVLLFAALLVLVWVHRAGADFRARLRLLAPFAALAATAALLYLPWLPAVIAQMKSTGPGSWREFVGAPAMIGRSWLSLSLGHTADPGVAPWLWLPLVLFAALAALGALPALRRGKGDQSKRALRCFTVAFAYLAVPLAAIELASQVKPIFNERYILVLLPAFALLVALGLSLVARRSRVILALALGLILAGQLASTYAFFYDRRYTWDDYRGAAQYLQAHLWPGDVVLLSAGSGYPAFAYYFGAPIGWRGPLQSYPGPAAPLPGPAVLQIGTVSDVPGLRLTTPEDAPQTPAEVRRRLASLAGRTRRIWHLRMLESVTDRQEVIHTWLDQNLFELDQRWFDGPSYLQLYLYTTRRPPAFDPPVNVPPMDVPLSNGAAVVGYELTPPEAHAGDLAVLTIYWKDREPIDRDYQVFVHLVDHSGQKWAQYDGPPLLGRYPTSRWQRGEIVRDEYAVRLPADLPVGLYHFKVGMYESDTLRPVAVASGAPSDGALLGELVVHPVPVGPVADRPALATLGGAIDLQAYRLDPASIKAGGQIELTLFWKTVADVGADYKVFVHLLDEKDQIISQQDAEPMQGRFPTGKWRTGDLIEDHHTLRIPADATPGTYRLAVGLYDPTTMRRLAVPDNADGEIVLGPAVLEGADNR